MVVSFILFYPFNLFNLFCFIYSISFILFLLFLDFPVLPAMWWRADTCGHLVHAYCSEGILRSTCLPHQWNGRDGYVFRCIQCRREARFFTGMNYTGGKSYFSLFIYSLLFIYLIIHLFITERLIIRPTGNRILGPIDEHRIIQPEQPAPMNDVEEDLRMAELLQAEVNAAAQPLIPDLQQPQAPPVPAPQPIPVVAPPVAVIPPLPIQHQEDSDDSSTVNLEMELDHWCIECGKLLLL